MEPIHFKEANTIIAEDQPEYIPLPAHQMKDTRGQVITCLKATWEERLQFLLTGKLWVSQLTFGDPYSPLFLSVFRHDMFITLKRFVFTFDRRGLCVKMFGYGVAITTKKPNHNPVINHKSFLGLYYTWMQPSDIDKIK